MPETTDLKVFVANCRPENWAACSVDTIFGLKQDTAPAHELKAGDLILVRITGENYGVKAIWYLKTVEKVTKAVKVPWKDADYKWLLRCGQIAELPNLFTEDFRTASKLSEKIPNFPASRIQPSIILLKSAEASAYLEGILDEFGDELNETVDYQGKCQSARELLVSVLQIMTKEQLGVEEEDTLSSDQISEPYDPSKIKVDLKPFLVFQLMRKIDLKEINLQPDFQRHVVWDDIRQSRLIESMLIRIPLPAFYLDAVNEREWLVVDGLQRLSTLKRFFNDNALRLKGLEFLEELNGLTFKELPRNFQREIEETQLTLYLIQPETPANVKFTIFYRINTGGLVLTAQEIRHCLFQGQATALLKDLTQTPEFLRATTNSISPKRMDDRECVLRFCAFHLQPYTEYQTSNLDGFLSQTMLTINKMDAASLEKLKTDFLHSMEKAENVFGRYAFRKMESRDGYRFPINKALFEVWAVSLMRHSTKKLAQAKDAIIDRYISLVRNDYQFLKSISQATGGIASVQRRFSTIDRLLKEVIDD